MYTREEALAEERERRRFHSYIVEVFFMSGYNRTYIIDARNEEEAKEKAKENIGSEDDPYEMDAYRTEDDDD